MSKIINRKKFINKSRIEPWSIKLNLKAEIVLRDKYNRFYRVNLDPNTLYILLYYICLNSYKQKK